MSLTRLPHWKLWLLLLVCALAIAWGLMRALERRDTRQREAQQAAQALQVPPVYRLGADDVARVEVAEVRLTVPVSGALRALRSASVKARVAGELRGLQRREGETVRAGETLAEVDPTDAMARVRQAEQQALAAQAQVVIARRTFDNHQALVGQGFISATALDTSQATLAGAEASHRAALAALDLARKNLSETRLLAPFDGEVAARWAQNGERVGVDARVLDLVDLSAFEIEAALTPAQAASVRVGQEVSLRVEGWPDPVTARVARLNPTVQAASRSVLAYLTLPASPGMRQGLFVQGHVVVGRAQAPLVPASSLRNDRPQPYLQTIEDGRVRHWAPPRLEPGLDAQGQPVLQVPDLAPGTPVLRAQAGLIREGTEVRLPDASAR